MAKVIHGDRIGATARLVVGCTAVIFDADRARVLLTRRADNGQWCLPGGRMEVGESVTEACAREVREEIGLEVTVRKLISVYSSPHRLIAYPDGNRYQVVSLCFEAASRGGVPGLSDEVTEVGYFSPAEMEGMDLLEPSREKVTDALAGGEASLVR